MITNAEYDYDNPYWPDTVMGHAVELLEQYRDKHKLSGLHIDLGCGYGRMAEDLVARCGVTYVGVDGHPAGLSSLSDRGFETHQLSFDDTDAMSAALERIIDGRPVASVSMLDTLEHLTNGDDVLAVIRALLSKHDAHAVISVPNFSHRDVGFKLAFGKIDYTEKGILDYTHVRWFSAGSLKRILQAQGLQIVDSNPVIVDLSDQNFPATHPALASGSNLNTLLTYYREPCDGAMTVGQFVHMVTPGPRSLERHYLGGDETKASDCFLSIITRTQGTRISCLEEMLNALAAQDDRSFEVLVLGHKMTEAQKLAVERVIDDCVGWLRDRIRLIRVDQGNRTRPLNVGFENARGAYAAILDDDDMPLGNWVSTFKRLAKERPGAVLRSVSARQDTTFAKVRGERAIRSVSRYYPYKQTFEFVEHLKWNESPPVGLAFPVSLFQDLNIRFDETLTTTEDWDYLMRCAALVGVHNNPDITSVYRWWSDKDQSSRTDHGQAEWTANHETILKKFDSMPIVLAPGLASKLGGQPLPAAGAPMSEETRATQIEIAKILTSRSWRWTKLLRLPAIRRGRPDPKLETCLALPDHEMKKVLEKLRRSGSWKKTRYFRKTG